MNFAAEPKLSKLQLVQAEEKDLEEIRLIAKNSFNYSRFHEDFNIAREASEMRYYYWIDDLVRQGKEIYICKLKNEIVGFHIQEIVENKARMILTGCKKGKEVLALSLWQEVLHNLKLREIKCAETLISASNIGVLNLYIYFRFKVVRTLFGMHILYK